MPLGNSDFFHDGFTSLYNVKTHFSFGYLWQQHKYLLISGQYLVQRLKKGAKQTPARRLILNIKSNIKLLYLVFQLFRNITFTTVISYGNYFSPLKRLTVVTYFMVHDCMNLPYFSKKPKICTTLIQWQGLTMKLRMSFSSFLHASLQRGWQGLYCLANWALD